MGRWSKWEPVDFVLIGLELIIVLMLVVIAIQGFFGNLNDRDKIDVIEMMIAGILAIIATYVGARIESRRRCRKNDD